MAECAMGGRDEVLRRVAGVPRAATGGAFNDRRLRRFRARQRPVSTRTPEIQPQFNQKQPPLRVGGNVEWPNAPWESAPNPPAGRSRPKRVPPLRRHTNRARAFVTLSPIPQSASDPSRARQEAVVAYPPSRPVSGRVPGFHTNRARPRHPLPHSAIRIRSEPRPSGSGCGVPAVATRFRTRAKTSYEPSAVSLLSPPSRIFRIGIILH